MALIRREQSPDPLASHLLYLWNKRWTIIIPAAVAALLTFIILQFVPEEYRVHSQIYVNKLTISDNESPANAAAVAALLESPMLLDQVRGDYTGKFHKKAPEIEKFVKQFKVKTDILQDTSVRKELSPVIDLQVQARGASETRFIMESWIHHAISDFGNITVQEAVDKAASLKIEDDKIDQQIHKTEIELAESDAKLPLLEKSLAENLNVLSTANLDKPKEDSFPRLNNDQGSIDLNLNIQGEPNRTGLLQQLNELKIQVGMKEAPATAPIAMKVLTDAIVQTQTSVTILQGKLAAAKEKQAAARRSLRLLMEKQTTLRGALNRFATIAALYQKVNINAPLPQGADIRALSIPVLPEKKVWPMRSLTGLGVGIGIGILMMLALLGMKYLEGLSPQTAEKGEKA